MCRTNMATRVTKKSRTVPKQLKVRAENVCKAFVASVSELVSLPPDAWYAYYSGLPFVTQDNLRDLLFIVDGVKHQRLLFELSKAANGALVASPDIGDVASLLSTDTLKAIATANLMQTGQETSTNETTCTVADCFALGIQIEFGDLPSSWLQESLSMMGDLKSDVVQEHLVRICNKRREEERG